MITGRLVEVKGKYYAILNLKHSNGKRLQKRFDLELPVPNNKRRAQEKLNALCEEYTRKQQVEQNNQNVVFMDFLQNWLELRKLEISPSTYRSYKNMADHRMRIFFHFVKSHSGILRTTMVIFCMMGFPVQQRNTTTPF